VPEFAALAREISAQSGLALASAPRQRVGGGSISACWRWQAGKDTLFVKLAPASGRAAFEAEAQGLAELSAARAIKVPRTLALGASSDHAFLALEWLQAQPPDSASERALGSGLAALHAVTAARFGWRLDNTIGATAQKNDWSDDWTQFFATRRLRPQLELACANGFGPQLGEAGARLLESLGALLAGHAPAPSLLHGDLWGGNWLVTTDGAPAIFDPAVYFGDRETDIAMTQLFGGFGPAFYDAYQAAAPLPAGAVERRELYNLYHVLNHANLFGGGYAQQARALIEGLLARLGH
jgi:protein-ribulosamine 3-kinase